MRGDDSGSEGRDGSIATYRERLYPSPVLVLVVLGLVSLVGVAYGAAYGATLGWTFGLLLAGAALALLAATSTPIRVDDRVVRAGRARLPLAVAAEAVPLDSDAMRDARRHGDPRAYLVLRAWSSPRGVRLDLDDARDPHPYWIITSRHPERLADAINAARADRIGRSARPQ